MEQAHGVSRMGVSERTIAQTWGVDEQLDVLALVLRVEEQQLADQRVGPKVLHLAAHEDDALPEQRAEWIACVCARC